MQLSNAVSVTSDPGDSDLERQKGARRLSDKAIRSALEPLRMRREMAKGQPKKQAEPSDTLVDVLIDIPLFDRLDGTELQVIVKHMNYIDVEPGEYVFKEGDKGSYMCFAARGVFDVLKKPVNGKSLPISLLRKGQSLGEMSVIDSYNRSATVRAKTKATLVTLSRDSFETILCKYPTIGIKLFRSLSRLMSLHLRKTSSGFADQLFLQSQEDMS